MGQRAAADPPWADGRQRPADNLVSIFLRCRGRNNYRHYCIHAEPDGKALKPMDHEIESELMSGYIGMITQNIAPDSL